LSETKVGPDPVSGSLKKAPWQEMILSSRYESGLLFFVYLFVFNLSFSEAIKEISLTVSILMALPWILLKADRIYWRRFFRMTWPIWGFVVISLLSALNSINLFQAMRGFWGDLMTALGLLVFWSVVSVSREPLLIVRRIILSLFGGLLAGGVVGVLTLLIQKTDNLGIMNLGDKNSTAQFLSFSLIIMVVCCFDRTRLRLPNVFFYIGIPVIIFLLLLCHSRAFLISLPTAVLIMFYLHGPKKVFFKGSAIVALVFSSLLLVPFVRKEVATALAPSHDGSFISRYETWKGAILMWKTHPFLGIGPDNFQMKNIHEIYHLPVYASHGHNFFFNLLGEYGTLGVVFMILWLVLWGRDVFAQEKRKGDPLFGKVLFLGILINLLMAGIAHPIWGASGSLLLMLATTLPLSSWKEEAESRDTLKTASRDKSGIVLQNTIGLI
jgi:O-antigen ligase